MSNTPVSVIKKYSVISEWRHSPVKTRAIYFFSHGSTAVVALDHPVRDTLHSVGLPWTSKRPVAETSTWQHIKQSEGIGTSHPSKRAVVDPRLRPRATGIGVIDEDSNTYQPALINKNFIQVYPNSFSHCCKFFFFFFLEYWIGLVTTSKHLMWLAFCVL